MLTVLRTLLIAILVTILSACVALDEIEVGESATALQPSTSPTLERSVKSIVDEQVGPATDASGKRRYAGISIAVIKNDARYHFHYGEAVRGSGQKPTSNTLYAIGSLTKTFTATMLALYDRRGTVDLTDRLDDHTGYPLEVPRTALTLEDLATHDSGLARNPPGGEAAYRSGTYAGDMRLLMETLDTCNNNPCAPRGDYEYSNYGFSVLAHVLASGGVGDPRPIVAHRPRRRRLVAAYPNVQSALNAQVISPLDMTSTSNKASLTEPSCVIGTCAYGDYGECEYAATCHETFSSRAAIGYGPDHTTRHHDEGSDDNVKAGSGVMWSTPADMLKWLAYNMDSNSGAPQEMRAILPTLHVRRHGNQALAWRYVTTPGGRSAMAKSGDLGGFSAYIAILEAGDVGVVVLTNSDGVDPSPLARNILDALAP